MDDTPQPSVSSGSSISIGTLFHLITLAAILAACARFLQAEGDAKIAFQGISKLVVGGAAIGWAIGIVTSAQMQFHGWLAPLLGLLLGMLVAPLLLIPFEKFSSIVYISFVGSWALIVFVLITNRLRMDPLKSWKDRRF